MHEIRFVTSMPAKNKRRSTICTIVEIPAGGERIDPMPVIAQGYAQCSLKDTFTKERGRTISLGRACKGSPPWVAEPAKRAWEARRHGLRQVPVSIAPIKPIFRSPDAHEPSMFCPVCDQPYIYPPTCYPGWCSAKRLAFRYVPRDTTGEP